MNKETFLKDLENLAEDLRLKIDGMAQDVRERARGNEAGCDGVLQVIHAHTLLFSLVPDEIQTLVKKLRDTYGKE